MAANGDSLRVAKIRRLADSEMLYGTLVRQAEGVVFLRMNNVGRIKKGEDFMIGLSGKPEMICLAKLLDDPPREVSLLRDGSTFRFGLLTELCPIGAL